MKYPNIITDLDTRSLSGIVFFRGHSPLGDNSQTLDAIKGCITPGAVRIGVAMKLALETELPRTVLMVWKRCKDI